MKISDENSKLGKIPNISLIPIADCGNCQFCKTDCYALKAWRQYPSTRAAWRENSEEWRTDPTAAAAAVSVWFAEKRAKGRAFLHQRHVDLWCGIALENPETRFLAFSKMYQLDYRAAPENLAIVLSMWPKLPAPRGRNSKLPRAWMQDGTEKRVPAGVIECPGRCDSCGMCWQLARLGGHVVFHAH